MSILVKESYANPAQPLWENSVAGNPIGAVSNQTIQTLPAVTAGLAQVTMPRNKGFYNCTATMNVNPFSSASITHTIFFKDNNNSDGAFNQSPSASVTTTGTGYGKYVTINWLYYTDSSPTSPVNMVVYGNSSAGGSTATINMTMTFTPA